MPRKTNISAEKQSKCRVLRSTTGSRISKKRKNGSNTLKPIEDNQNTQIGVKQLSVTTKKEYRTGAFVVARKDIHLCRGTEVYLWKIDGTALLQKFEPFTENGKMYHRSTPVYTGWSTLNQDQYALVTVIIRQKPPQQIVELVMDSLEISVNEDSD